MDHQEPEEKHDALPLFGAMPENAPVNPPPPAAPSVPAAPAPVPPVPSVVPAPAPLPPVAPPMPPVVPVAAPARRILDYGRIPTDHFGPFLKELRLRNKITIREIADSTHIRTTYIEAVEEEDFDTLPPTVYTLAYVKKLCDYYELPEELINTLTAEIRHHLEYEAPEDPTKAVVDVELSQENPVLFKRILLIGGTAIFFFAALVTVLILWLIPPTGSSRIATGAADAPASIDEKVLFELQPPVKLAPAVLSGN